MLLAALMLALQAAPATPAFEGEARLRCTVQPDGKLTGCSVAQEQPAGRGVGPAALAMAGRMRLEPARVEAVRKSGKPEIEVPVKFALPAAEMAQSQITPDGWPTLLAAPEWRARPNSFQLDALYPKRARQAGVSGRSNVLCVVGARGALERCRSLFEEPGGYGFGEATQKAAEKHAWVDLRRTGEGAVGRSVWFPMTWSLDR
jgi:TonB family protein